MASCPRCGEKTKGFFRLCGLCDQATTILTKSKTPGRPIQEPEDDE